MGAGVSLSLSRDGVHGESISWGAFVPFSREYGYLDGCILLVFRSANGAVFLVPDTREHGSDPSPRDHDLFGEINLLGGVSLPRSGVTGASHWFSVSSVLAPALFRNGFPVHSISSSYKRKPVFNGGNYMPVLRESFGDGTWSHKRAVEADDSSQSVVLLEIELLGLISSRSKLDRSDLVLPLLRTDLVITVRPAPASPVPDVSCPSVIMIPKFWVEVRPKMGQFRSGKAWRAITKSSTVGLHRSSYPLGLAPTSSKRDLVDCGDTPISSPLDLVGENFPPLRPDSGGGVSGEETVASRFGIRSVSGPRRSAKATPTTNMSSVHTKPTTLYGSVGANEPESRALDPFTGDSGSRILGCLEVVGDNGGRTFGILNIGPEFGYPNLLKSNTSNRLLGTHANVKTSTTKKNGVQILGFVSHIASSAFLRFDGFVPSVGDGAGSCSCDHGLWISAAPFDVGLSSAWRCFV